MSLSGDIPPQDLEPEVTTIRIKGRDPEKKLKSKAARQKEKGKVRFLAHLLGLSPRDAGDVIHEAKKEGGLGGQDNLDVSDEGELSHDGEDLTSG